MQGARSEKCLQLAQLHSDAVDFPKTGRKVELSRDLVPKQRPDFMANKHQCVLAIGTPSSPTRLSTLIQCLAIDLGSGLFKCHPSHFWDQIFLGAQACVPCRLHCSTWL